MRTILFIILFLAGCIISNFLFAQYSQQGPKLVGIGAVGSSTQGTSVAISPDGNTALVGGPYDNDYLGATWVLTRSSGVWSQQGPKLVGTGLVGYPWQGSSVAISSDGNTAIVGGPYDNTGIGAVWIFTRSGGVWTQQGPKLIGTGAVGTTAQGYSVAISSDGNTVVVGAPYDNAHNGAVWIFTRSGDVWSQQGPKLVGTGAIGTAGSQGYSVSISSDGNTAVIGGNEDNVNTGAIWIFTRSGGVWTQQGPKLVGTGSVGTPWQGSSVAISSDGNTFIEGGPYDNSFKGATWIFTRSGGVWTQQGQKLIGTGAIGTRVYQGWSVAIISNGNIVIEGGSNDNSSAGAVWIFTRNGGIWSQVDQKLVGTGAIGTLVYQGWSVAISSNGSTAIEGAQNDNAGIGAVWVFVNPSIGITTISTEIPENFSLSQNYPNPFNPSTNIRYDLPKNEFVKLVVFDMLGREIETLVNEKLNPGSYEVTFDGSNLTSGIYFYILKSGNYTETKKMLLIK